MAEQNYGNQKSGVSSGAGVGEQHMQQTGSRSSGQAQVRESSGQLRAKNSRRSARGSVTGEGVWSDAQQRLRTLKQDTDDYVRKNPAKAVFTALGIGFMLALMRRR